MEGGGNTRGNTPGWTYIPLGRNLFQSFGVGYVFPPPSTYFGTSFSCQNFATKLVSITFFLRPEEELLVLTSQKFVWIYYYYLQFCFAMWIIYFINQPNEKPTLYKSNVIWHSLYIIKFNVMSMLPWLSHLSGSVLIYIGLSGILKKDHGKLAHRWHI